VLYPFAAIVVGLCVCVVVEKKREKKSVKKIKKDSNPTSILGNQIFFNPIRHKMFLLGNSFKLSNN
jgi:hypothetical protein